MFGRKSKKAAEARRAASAEVASRGWQWHDAAPAPAQEICEAVLRRGRGPIWPIGMSEVVDGTVSGRPFTGGHLVGYDYRTGNGGNAFGDRASVNVVWMPLPASLPELRIVDDGVRSDDGVRLPPLHRPAGVSARWSFEGFIPGFAEEVLTPAFIAVLEGAPASCTIVIRAGVILCYGDPVGDAAGISSRATLLSALIDQVPAPCWGRADALIAGTGVSPVNAPDGASLVLTERLVTRDWKGYGLAKVAWQQAPEAAWMVSLSNRESQDVWRFPASASSPPSGGLHVSGADIQLSAPADLGIPTVASTLAGGKPPAS
ncbi:hypothetical protein ET475_03935 [Microbacterium protaetiae]|uniref:Uncharacterized protein n=1 Tax=Microbacterium protaetiae TaxID=2509458 RepID=A0A4P6EAU1_9MICO|nr:hypothetical protein [Microbacterium protaetiae]QAY59225.1 hypothetical protein ET475_03935 [Microbacterium protaetiae]